MSDTGGTFVSDMSGTFGVIYSLGKSISQIALSVVPINTNGY